jgi:nondiscriminating glutamyl-tRNA synthetase
MTRVRIAPSPTGNLHIGTAQSALYNWLFARKNKGEFFLRIEDTDKARSTKESEENIIEALSWLDLKWDGNFSRSSDNYPRYQELLEKLLKEEKAFYCHHTQEELETERKQQEKNKEAPRHICEHKKTSEGKQAGGIIRLAVDEKSDRIISFDDQIRGHLEFGQSLLGDFSIGRAVDDPLYHFAVVVDDADMRISHVLRGEDHISNTPKQILIYEALEFSVPTFAHLPLILAPDRSKMSKRHGDTAATSFKKDYLPEAIINFLGCLSYSFSKELITKEEMIEEFEISKVHKSGAIFDVKKLNWINSQYVKNLSLERFRELTGINLSEDALSLVTERLEKLSDAKEFAYLWEDEVSYDRELLKWKKSDLDMSLKTLVGTKEIINNFDFKEGKDAFRKVLDDLASRIGDRGLVYWPLRVALSGREKSPDPVDITFVLGREKALKRITNALEGSKS